MDVLPEELLRVILIKYLECSEDRGEDCGEDCGEGRGNDTNPSPSLATVSKRFAYGCATCREMRDILMDAYAPQQISVSMTFDELFKLTRVLFPTTMGSFPGPSVSDHGGYYKCSARRLFETWVGGVDLIGDGPGHRTTTRRAYFTMALSGFAAAFRHSLRRLCITAPEDWRSEVFDCQVISTLHCLEELKVDRFKDVSSMWVLPGTVRRLEIGFGEVFDLHVLSSHGISMLDLPKHLELEYLRVSKQGTVGVIMRQLLGQAREVEIECKYLLVAVSVDDPDGAIVTLFRNPFLEGRYVPPHVLADWDMIEASHRATDVTCTQLLEQIARQDRLKRLRIIEEAGSVKVVPVTPGEECSSLRWVSSISEHQNQLMFGLSGPEFQARRDVLLAAKMRRGVECDWLRRLDIVASEETSMCEFRISEDGTR